VWFLYDRNRPVPEAAQALHTQMPPRPVTFQINNP
jgi:hypothetical protein